MTVALLEKVERHLNRICSEWGNTTAMIEANCARKLLTAYRATLADADVVEVARRAMIRALSDSGGTTRIIGSVRYISAPVGDLSRAASEAITPILRAKLEQEIRREVVEEVARCADQWRDAPDHVLLHAGEMTAQELRTARACAGGIASAIRALAPKQDGEVGDG